MLWSHAIIILSEIDAAMLAHTREDSSRFGYDTRINLALGRSFRSAQSRSMRCVTGTPSRASTSSKCAPSDVIVTPTTATVAPLIPENTLPEGESNLQLVDALMRFIRIEQLTGFPALSLPAGYSSEGLAGRIAAHGPPLRRARVVPARPRDRSRDPRRAPANHFRALD